MGDNWSGYPNGRIPLSLLTQVYSGLGAGGFLQTDAARAFYNIQAAAKQAGFNLTFNEGYRDYAKQEYYRDQYLHHNGSPAAIPGTSKHGYALAMDLDWPMNSWTSNAQQWWSRNEASFGWSSAQGKIDGEPWHKVYVGGTTTAAGGNVRPLPVEEEPQPPWRDPDMPNFIKDTVGTIWYGNYGIPSDEMYQVIKRYDNSARWNPSTKADNPLDTVNGIQRGWIANALAANGMTGAQQVVDFKALARDTAALVIKALPAGTDAKGIAAAVEASLLDDFAGIPKAVNDDAAHRLSS